MSYVAVLLGIMLLLYGCAQFASGTQPPASSAQPPASGTPSPAPGSQPPATGNQTTACEDGTAFSTCTPDKPFYCNQYGSIVEKASVCGCTSGTTVSGDTCARTCTDGTLPGECSSTKPSFCTQSLTLVSDPQECGCPDGTALSGGSCTSAHCIDGTLIGGCSESMRPMYCGEDLTLVRNPPVCGCLSGEILSEDGATCMDISRQMQDEGTSFKVFDDAYMRVRDSEMMECEGDDYIKLQLRVDNELGDSAYPLDQFDVSLLEVSGPGSGERTFIPVKFPPRTSECNETSRFAWTYTYPGDINTGMVWFKLDDGFDPDADYYFYYREFTVELNP